MTFREYMEKQAKEAKEKIAIAKGTKGGLNSVEIQELFRLDDIIRLNSRHIKGE